MTAPIALVIPIPNKKKSKNCSPSSPSLRHPRMTSLVRAREVGDGEHGADALATAGHVRTE